MAFFANQRSQCSQQIKYYSQHKPIKDDESFNEDEINVKAVH